MAHNNGMIPRAPKKGNKRIAKTASENAAKFHAAVTPRLACGRSRHRSGLSRRRRWRGMSEGNVATFIPHRPARPEKSEGGKKFKLVSEYEPAGDQPTAIAELVKGVRAQERDQVLLGVTGSGKTFTMAQIISTAPSARR